MNYTKAIASALLLMLAPVASFTTPSSISARPIVAKSSTMMNMMDVEPTQFSNVIDMIHSMPSNTLADMGVTEVPEPAYSKVSYYTTLGLYVMSFPGIWSQIKRSTSAKIKRKTYISDGESVEGGKDLRQQAGEIMACKCKGVSHFQVHARF